MMEEWKGIQVHRLHFLSMMIRDCYLYAICQKDSIVYHQAIILSKTVRVAFVSLPRSIASDHHWPTTVVSCRQSGRRCCNKIVAASYYLLRIMTTMLFGLNSVRHISLPIKLPCGSQ